jgi:SAM-dependent methyltransferase
MPDPPYALAGRGLEIGPGDRPFIKGATKLEKALSYFGHRVEADVLGDATQLPFRIGVFDYVVARHVLEHVADPIRMLREISRALRPGGRAVITVPNRDNTFDIERPTTPFLHMLWDFISQRLDSDPSHAREWTEKVLLNSEVRPYRTYQSEEEDHREHDKLQADLQSGARLDMHFHVFSALSFQKLLIELNRIRLLKMRIECFDDPDPLEPFAVTAVLERE